MNFNSYLSHLWRSVCCLTLLFRHCWAYYDSISCYGTGDCLFSQTSGGHADDQHKWNTECHDGEAMIAILDGGSDYQGFGQVWCRFMFPKKAPTFGLYPYYDFCNVRDISLREFYCYDKLYPSDTYDTFMAAVSSSQYYPGGISVSSSYKCCRLPAFYHFDYRRCEYKYTHDRWGEHYDGSYWFVKCDRNYIMTGMGQGANPWTNAIHYVWIQCCPLFYDPLWYPPYAPAQNVTFTTPSPPSVEAPANATETEEVDAGNSTAASTNTTDAPAAA